MSNEISAPWLQLHLNTEVQLLWGTIIACNVKKIIICQPKHALDYIFHSQNVVSRDMHPQIKFCKMFLYHSVIQSR